MDCLDFEPIGEVKGVVPGSQPLYDVQYLFPLLGRLHIQVPIQILASQGALLLKEEWDVLTL
jgi:hypothetical protein